MYGDDVFSHGSVTVGRKSVQVTWTVIESRSTQGLVKGKGESKMVKDYGIC